jgi:uncharacterized membrane protein YfcA
MALTGLDYLAAAGAAGAAGLINAVAGGGTLVSFPTLVAIGVPAVSANVTNTVSLLPGYLSGTWAQRDDVRPQMGRARPLMAAAIAGGLGGSVLLVTIPSQAFRVAVPYLILASCLLLLVQDRLRDLVMSGSRRTTPPSTANPPEIPGRPAAPASTAPATDTSTPASTAPATDTARWRPVAVIAVFVAAIYGGFFGAGLGIMLLAVLGLFSVQSLVHINALKQLLSFLINCVAAVFFAFSGHVHWGLVPVMAAASIIGGIAGGHWVKAIDVILLRRVVVVVGVSVAVAFWAA